MGSSMTTVTKATSIYLELLLAERNADQIAHKTYDNAQRDLVKFAAQFGEVEIDSIKVDDLILWIPTIPNLGWRSRNLMRTHISNLYRWAMKREMVNSNPTDELRVYRAPKDGGDDRRKPVNDETLELMFARSDRRSKAMLMVFLHLGLRRQELAQMRIQDWDRIDGSLRVHGKGNKRRDVPVSIEAAHWMADWVGDRTEGWFWPSPRKHGEHLSDVRIWQIIKRLSGGETCVHSLRHRSATDALRGGADLESVRDLLGHSNVKTTSIYLHSLAPHKAITGRSYSDFDPAA